MKIKFATACFVLATMLAPIAAYAADGDSDRTHPIAYVKDSAITTKVKAKLAEETMKSLVRINVDTDANGAVALSGVARSQVEADRAIALARETEGVTSVKSTIKVKKDN